MSPDKPRRQTKQQAAVAAALATTTDFTSAQDLHAGLRAGGQTVGLATVYRALQTMAADGSVDTVRTDDGEALYRQCSQTHHHHLLCRDCGRTVEVEGPAVERWTERVSAEHGFTAVTHSLEIEGRCPECTRTRQV